jgi:prepilin-type N-terminal cleavage/methylation domain-containing protein
MSGAHLGFLGKKGRCSKAGFTLVELVVALLIAVIVIAAAGGILITSMNLSAKTTKNVQDTEVLEALADFSRNSLRNASEIQALNGGAAMPSVTDMSGLLYVGDETGAPAQRGYLYVKRAGDTSSAINAFGVAFYNGGVVSLDYTVEVSSGGSGGSGGSAPKRGIVLVLHLYDASGAEVRTATRSFFALNIMDDVSQPTTNIELIGATQTPPYYLNFKLT